MCITCLNRISKAGSVLCGISVLLLCSITACAQGRDAAATGDWLCSRVFADSQTTLAFTCDGFFGLRRLVPGHKPNDITGQWRLDPDGIELTLFTHQDRRMLATVGKSGLHASLGQDHALALTPSEQRAAKVAVTGLLEKTGANAIITDAASGHVFQVAPLPEAMPGKFATAEITIENGAPVSGMLLRHSMPIPRFYENAQSRAGMEVFSQEVTGKYWLLPRLPGVEQAALRFGAPRQAPGGECEGVFDITGPGLRVEGEYKITDKNLTLATSRSTIDSLKLLGAGALSDVLIGEMTWRLLSRGLEINGPRRLLLLANQS